MNEQLKPHNQASAWFDDLYTEHKEQHENIPWARLEVNPLLKEYLQKTTQHQGKALVIGCGLGDDARAIEVAGYDVVAIDVSQKALELAQERFPESDINFEKQDIFDMPDNYHEYFDFVFEAFTIQSLPVEFRETMIKAVAQTVAAKGKLLLVAHKREHMFNGPPWPLEEKELSWFQNDLTQLYYEIHSEASPLSNSRFNVLYQKI